MTITTEATTLLGTKNPILLAGMGRVAGPPLAAAVSNAGGLGVIGGVGYTPKQLRSLCQELKSLLNSPDLPFGVDLLIPQVGGNARKTNYDYTKGGLDELVDIIIEEGAKMFVSAVGVPPKAVVDKLHRHGVLYGNMIGHPKHIKKCGDLGVDIIIAQGGEGGGHTGEIPTSVLIPACVSAAKQYKSPITGKPPLVVAAGGIATGAGVAAALMLGASAVWIGTRFVTATEAGATKRDKELMVAAGFDATLKSTIWTGRPLRHLKTTYTEEWETTRKSELEEIQATGQLAMDVEMDRLAKEGKLTEEIEDLSHCRPAGVVAALCDKAGQSAGDIVREMVQEAEVSLRSASRFLGGGREARL
jgi:NAD(P)H-dependent flavin oxidoreductase YrpB (nitropropane dioxygenase family)